MTARMRFVGVSTASSSIMRIFPVWADLLGLDAELVGLDLPLEAAPEDYRRALTGMREDPDCVGALVTTHKISLLEATRDLFDDLDPFAATVGEVSSIAFRDGRTHGSAKDPLTAGLALEEVLGEDHFSDGGEVVCLGAGGAGTAIGWYLAHRADRAAAMSFVDVSPSRLEHLREVLTTAAPEVPVRTVPVAQADLAATLPDLPAGSLVVNATGLGKDRPGSPLPDGVLLPRGSVVWELNYRGSLEFLHQAQAQAADRDLTVVDGWRYFIHGWTQVIAEVFGVPMGTDRVAELSDAARSA
ncbi:shikimate dehydrogenase family protein [Ornithinimicrobium sediminis]|uniref:shikimate dehydrogenase family protein n=1 Tax=Ornithinimicrobium sediminis TaxID=2904603 RepID=UPI001E3FD81D|nr:shikimate dehydrogenase [Ornithinimicrobium sediminis]MCE0487387.1 shikimate dehydrogenase [Ornithinimicrobium sediminis]